MAAAIICDKPMPHHVHGFRLFITKRIIEAAREERPGSPRADFKLNEYKSPGLSGCEDARDFVCDICWYYHGNCEQDVNVHKIEKHQSIKLLCEWPTCRDSFLDEDTLQLHIKHHHELKTWICPIKICHRRFLTQEFTQKHIKTKHLDVENIHLRFLEDTYRQLDLTTMRTIRARGKKSWKISFEGVEVCRNAISDLYASYYDRSSRKFFNAKGVLDQNIDAHIDHCRTINQDYNKTASGSIRPQDSYSHRSVNRRKAWWILFLNTEDGAHLDKFIQDSCTKHCFNVSHRCHHAFYYVADHLEFVLRVENDDKIICKNDNRETEGECNALKSCHPFNHCFLRYSWEVVFDAVPQEEREQIGRGERRDKPVPVAFDAEPQEEREQIGRGESRDKSGPGFTTVSGPRPRPSNRTGPCVYGHITTTLSQGWKYHPRNESILCFSCYKKITRNPRSRCQRCERLYKKEKADESDFICLKCDVYVWRWILFCMPSSIATRFKLIKTCAIYRFLFCALKHSYLASILA